MKIHTVTIAEGKKDFSRLVREALEEDIIVTRRGKPVAVLLSFEEYKRIKRHNALKKVLETRESLVPYNITASDIYKETKRQL